MISQQQFLDAVADFSELVAEGSEIASALTEAGQSNGVDSTVLEKRLTANQDLESIVAEIRLRAKHGAFHRALIIEVRNYWKSIQGKTGLGWIFNEPHRTGLIKSAIEARLGRLIGSAEENQVRDHFFDIIQKRLV